MKAVKVVEGRCNKDDEQKVKRKTEEVIRQDPFMESEWSDEKSGGEEEREGDDGGRFTDQAEERAQTRNQRRR